MSYYLIHTTYLILFIAVFARQLCIPVPALLFLLSAGALAGSHKLSYAGILTVAVLGCTMADFIWYEAGRLQGKRVLRVLCALAPDPSYCIRSARKTFARRGVRLLLVAKFVPGLDGICPPLAGMSGVSKRTFILHDAAGATLWCGAYITGGFLFAKEVDRIAHYTSLLADGVVLLLGIPLVLFVALKSMKLIRHIRLLRARRISPEMLKARLDAGENIGIIDLLRFEEDPEDVAGIPGAVRLDPMELRRKRRVVLPPDLDVVLYCRSENSFVSARAAAAMQKHGIDTLYVLLGGLAAWESLGYPVSCAFATPVEELARLHIEVYPPWNSPGSTRPFRRSRREVQAAP